MSSFNPGRPLRVVLKPGRDGPARKRRHPWIYSQAVGEAPDDAAPRELLPIHAAEGALLGWGFYSARSLIAVRMVSFGHEKPAEDWIARRIRAAWSLRESLGIDSDAIRLVNAEGDSIPGLVVDLYGGTAVISAHVKGVEAEIDRVAACLREKAPALCVYFKRDEHYARVEGLSLASGYIAGEGDGACVVREGAAFFRVDFARGQKTGFYLDQRENRRIIARCCRKKRLLNLFSYTGAVAIQSVAAGAAHAVSVESSQRALEASKENVTLNPGLPGGAFEWIQEDAFAFLGSVGSFDVVVADPPPFARRRAEVEGALRGYLSLFQMCIRALVPGGLAFFFSCSGAVDRPTFRQVVVDAALRSGRNVRLLGELHADADHPVSAAHPEGEYLKGWMVHAE